MEIEASLEAEFFELTREVEIVLRHEWTLTTCALHRHLKFVLQFEQSRHPSGGHMALKGQLRLTHHVGLHDLMFETRRGD
jgi:predicted nucleotidyltransferase